MTDVLDAHLTRHLGAGEPDRDVGGVAVWRHERPEFVSFATHGLAGVRLEVIHPQEIVCSVRHGQDGAALELVTRTLELVLGHRRGLAAEQLIANDRGALLAGTDIVGVLVASHPYLEDDFGVLVDADGSVLADIRTLIPVTGAEVARAGVDGVDGLIDLLEITDPPLLDVTRS